MLLIKNILAHISSLTHQRTLYQNSPCARALPLEPIKIDEFLNKIHLSNINYFKIFLIIFSYFTMVATTECCNTQYTNLLAHSPQPNIASSKEFANFFTLKLFILLFQLKKNFHQHSWWFLLYAKRASLLASTEVAFAADFCNRQSLPLKGVYFFYCHLITYQSFRQQVFHKLLLILSFCHLFLEYILFQLELE